MTFEELVETLTGWTGREVHVLLGPEGETAGRLYVRWHGRLGKIRPDAPLDPQGDAGAVAFQIGENEESVLAVHPEALRHAEWVSRRHGFLTFGMTGVEVGIEAQAEA